MAKLINIPSIIALSVFLTLLIIFDAAQQQYYVQSFDLNGSTLSFASFVLLHTVRWACWLIFTIPLVIYTWRLPNLEQPFLTSARLPSTLIYSLIMTILSIITITIISIYRQEFTLSWSLFLEFNEFFVYQKGLIFFLAHLGIILCIVNLKQRKTISSQWQEIELLKTKSNNRTNTNSQEMIVKKGDLRERIQVKDIIWIQADDYCVRVHTESKTFCLRKSLKFLEEKLKADGFIRIHRGALVNMNFLKNIDYRDAKVVLKNELELSLSKSGKYMVKKHIQKVTV